jgi:hypothetical protein
MTNGTTRVSRKGPAQAPLLLGNAAEQHDDRHPGLSQYVVNTIPRVRELSGRKVDIIGPGQGDIEPRFAPRFRPDLRDYIGFGATDHGSVVIDAMRVPGCSESLWQQRYDSNHTQAMNSCQEKFPSSTDSGAPAASTSRARLRPAERGIGEVGQVVVQGEGRGDRGRFVAVGDRSQQVAVQPGCGSQVVGHIGQVGEPEPP